MLKSAAKALFQGGQLRELAGKQRKVVELYALAAVLYNFIMIYGHYWGMDIILFLWTDMLLLAPLGFLAYSVTSVTSEKERTLSADSVILASVTFAVFIFWVVDSSRISEMAWMGSRPSAVEAIMGWLVILLMVEGARRTLGLVLPLLTGGVLAYTLLVVGVPFSSVTRLVLFQGTAGLWGIPTQVMVTILVLVFVFAGLMASTGASKFMLYAVGFLIGSSKGGGAKMATVASSAFGMVCGGAPPNVAVTGVVTIPAMLRSGFKPQVAGAFESVASTGGAITPPVLGSVAFVMSAILGIPYIIICLKSVPMAFIFYLILYLQAHWIALREGIGGVPKPEPLPRGEMIKSGSAFLIPLLILVAMLIGKYSLQLSFIVSIISMIAVVFLITKGGGWRQVFEGLILGAYNSVYLVFIIAFCSLFLELLTISALNNDIQMQLQRMMGGNLFLILVSAALFCLLLGMAGEILAAYILVLGIIIPTVAMLGIPVLLAHMFCFYFCVMGYITPPVCTAVFVANRFVPFVSYWKIGWESVKLALPLWILPFYFIYRPEFLWEQGSLVDTFITIGIVAAGILLLAAANTGMLLTRLGTVERLICLIAGVALVFPHTLLDLAGGAIAGGILIYEVIKWAQRRRGLVTSGGEGKRADWQK